MDNQTRKPSILLINQYFWPDMAATAQLLTDLAEDLVADGHEVSVITGRGVYALETERLPRSRETWKGIVIRRFWRSSRGRSSMAGRVFDYASFLTGAGLAVLLGRKRDVVICLSTPPLVAMLGLLAGLRGSAFVYKVEDLYPDVAIAMGLFGPRSLPARFFRWLSRSALRHADTVVALDESMKSVLESRGAGRVVVIPNWADGEAIAPDARAGERFRSLHDLEDRFLVLYSGNLGMVHRFDAVIEAASRLSEVRPEVLFLFVGAGPRLAEVKKAAEGLDNVRFLPYQPRETLREVFNAADIHLVTLRPEVAGLLVPSKYASALAAGKPVLLVGGEGTDLCAEIAAEAVGWICPHDSREVVDAVLEAASDPDAAAECGRRGRVLFDAKYNRALATGRWMSSLRDLGA